MEAPKKALRKINLLGVTAATICPATEVSDSTYKCESNLIRVYAESEVTLKQSGINVTPMKMPAGSVEFFQVNPTDEIEITGTANITSVY